MTTCPNCNTAIDDYGECSRCAFNHQQLVERLHEPDRQAPTIAVWAGWVVFGRRVKPERAWWIA